MKKRIIYERLACKSFHCLRSKIYFANADIFDALILTKKEEKLKEYVLISLKELSIYGNFSNEQL